MQVQFPPSFEELQAAWTSIWNKVPDRTQLPLFINQAGTQVGVGTTNPYTYSTSAVLVVSGDTYGITPVGTIIMYGATAAPTGYLYCNGQSITTAAYANLFNII